ncbi:glycoside hydrolase family 2 protein [Hyalangium gracile]|uniref:glycoside hydrolase family 2 protein n=1 Tax=Hyalangium gracile TaxID=394092 RepID=UPI001CCAEA64|nr:glycoside hydrolase family 2 TIM barrel-domain containing protein [Hyalangium gracile]
MSLLPLTAMCSALLAAASVGRAGALSLEGRWIASEQELTQAPRSLPEGREMPVPSNWYRHGIDRGGVVWFSREVRLPTDGHFRLEFGGVDYEGQVFWDGQKVGGHRGYFAPFSLKLPPGRAGSRHLLAVRVDSPLESPEDFSQFKTLIKGVLSHHDTRPGGAWSPRGQEANTGGIWGAVRLVPVRAAWIGDARVRTLGASARRARLRVEIQLDEVLEPEALLDFVLREPGGTVVARVELGRVGQQRRFEREVWLARPRLWWPRELGEPALHDLEVRVRGQAGEDRLARRVGIRTVRQDAGRRLIVNGVPLFVRGTNYIGSLYLAELDRGMAARDLALMEAAHINAVRVHAHLSSPAFYDEADARGMLVWQDFPLQWGYDDSPAFAQEARRQVGEMLSAFGHHPSIVFWTGHNEAPWSSEWMVYKYGARYNPDQNRELARALAEALSADTTRPHQVNSPPAEHAWAGWYFGSYREFSRPAAHPVLTEFGAQAVPARATLETFLRPEQLWPLEGSNLELWTHHNFQLRELRDLARVPTGGSVDELIENSQRYQARLLQFAAEQLRRQKWQPVTALFQFMFVEHWPSMNWGMLDHLRQPKQGYAALARAYQPVLAVASRPRKDGPLRLSLVNDRQSALPGLSLRVRFGEDDTRTRELRVDVPANGVLELPEELPPPAPTESLRLTLIEASGAALSDNHYAPGYFTP